MGGMAETWRAQWAVGPNAGKQVALKRMLPELARDPVMVEMFLEEARVSLALDHANIARVYEYGEDAGQPWLAMELVEGLGLDRVLKRTKARNMPHLPIPIALTIAIDVAHALHHAHTCVGDDGAPLNIIHRDVSPDNVMVSASGSSKLLDFGVAKSEHEGRKETAAGIAKGKFAYFSPEQARSEKLDRRSDVYALGNVFYRMVCGVPPYRGTTPVVLLSVSSGDYAPPLSANPRLPPKVVRLIERAMAADRDERFDSALAFAKEMDAVRRQLSPGAGAGWVKRFVDWIPNQGAQLPAELDSWRPQPADARPTRPGLPPEPEEDEFKPSGQGAFVPPEPEPPRDRAAETHDEDDAAGTVGTMVNESIDEGELDADDEGGPPAAAEAAASSGAVSPARWAAVGLLALVLAGTGGLAARWLMLRSPERVDVVSATARPGGVGTNSIPAPSTGAPPEKEAPAAARRTRSCEDITGFEDPKTAVEGDLFIFLVQFRSGGDLLLHDSQRDPAAGTRIRSMRSALEQCRHDTGHIEYPRGKQVSDLPTRVGNVTGELVSRSSVEVKEGR